MNEQPSKIYLLPNLMTAGNLFCGFTATLKILEGALLQSANADLAADRFHEAIWFILGAFVFDFLDGRLARLGGHDTVFGREFGGALRLARFNSAAAAHNGPNHQNTFTGFPIPAAAGLIASITLFLLWLAEGEHHLGNWRFVLPPLLLFLSFMMFSRFQYPSFKAVNWKTKKSIPRFLAIILVLIFTLLNYEWMPAVLFLAYLLYGVVRPWLSREWQREIEEEIGEEPPDEAAEQTR